jgi:hypothetical protein
LRSCQLCSYSRISKYFMEPDGSVPCSEEHSRASQINPVHTTPSDLRSILILSTHLRLGLPSGLFPSDFPTIFSPIHATCPAITSSLIHGENHNLCSASIGSFIQAHVTSSLFGPNILLSIRSQTPSVHVLPLIPETKFHIHKEAQGKF